MEKLDEVLTGIKTIKLEKMNRFFEEQVSL